MWTNISKKTVLIVVELVMHQMVVNVTDVRVLVKFKLSTEKSDKQINHCNRNGQMLLCNNQTYFSSSYKFCFYTKKSVSQ